MAGAGHILGARAEFHRQHQFRDQRASIRADDMRAQDLIRCLVSQDFHKPIHIAHGAGPAIRGEGEFPDLIGNAARLELFLGFTH